MPLHILTAIALLSAAHQGIQVAASSSNLGAPSSKTAAIPKKRFLRSSASAQDLVESKEPAQFDKVAHAQESLFAASAAGGDSSSSEIEATASLAPGADVRRLSVSKEPAKFDDGLFGKTRLPLAARKYLRDDSNKQSSILFEGTIYSRGSNDRSSGVVLDWATGAEIRTPCPDTSGSRTVSYADLRDAANFAYKEKCSTLDETECLKSENDHCKWDEGKCSREDFNFKMWEEHDHIEEDYGDGEAEAKIVVADGVIVLAFRGTDDGTDIWKAIDGCDSSLVGDWVYNCDEDPKTRAGVKVHGGFLEYFELLERSVNAKRADLKNECGLDFDFVVGHSLGGAAATLYGEFNPEVLGEDGKGKNGVVTFGAPRTHWAQSKACSIDGVRFYHSQDIVTSNLGSDKYHHAVKTKFHMEVGGYVQQLNPSFPGTDTCECDSACHCTDNLVWKNSCACWDSFGCMQHGLNPGFESGDGYSWWIPEDKMALPSPAPSPRPTPRPQPRPTPPTVSLTYAPTVAPGEPTPTPSVLATPAPTPTPGTPRPTASTGADDPLDGPNCDSKKGRDSKSWHRKNKPKKTCKWVERKASKRCRKRGATGVRASSECVRACGSCPLPTCPDDAPGSVMNKKGRMLSCDQVARNPARRCSLPGAADACRATCGTCP